MPIKEPSNSCEIFGEDIYCPKCAYCLFGATGEACSECGYSLENLRRRDSQIPWTRRRQVGRIRAYWKTVAFVVLRNRRFCEEYARNVSYNDARRFQWVTCGLLGRLLPKVFFHVLHHRADRANRLL